MLDQATAVPAQARLTRCAQAAAGTAAVGAALLPLPLSHCYHAYHQHYITLSAASSLTAATMPITNITTSLPTNAAAPSL